MGSSRFVALLRGINVGGRNPVAMADLRSILESAGYGDVRTYIQSGNVVFDSDDEAAAIEDRIEAVLSEALGLDLMVVVRSESDFRRVVDEAPDGFGVAPEKFHYDVVFLRCPLTSGEAYATIGLREGVDSAWVGTRELYFARLSERRAQSRLSKVMQSPQYRLMTIRNWRTVNKLTEMLAQ